MDAIAERLDDLLQVLAEAGAGEDRDPEGHARPGRPGLGDEPGRRGRVGRRPASIGARVERVRTVTAVALSVDSEIKWDGVRAIVSTTNGLRVRSRRGWNMTELVPELADLPPRLMLDGELIAYDDSGRPNFPMLCDRMLHRKPGIRSCA
jgi:hypothetical protein